MLFMPFLIKANSHGRSWEVKAPLSGPTLLEFLYSQEVPIRSSCMGKGICHQCRVRVINGPAPVAQSDRKAFSPAALEEGWRLSCQLRPKTQIEIEFPQVYQFSEHQTVDRAPVSDWWLAVDLGTTGIEIAAIDNQGEWCRIRALNSQVIMGADVMTRLEYAQRLGVEALHHRLFRQLKKLVNLISEQSSESVFSGRALVGGNSAMVSFLHQWPIENLAVSPFQPDCLEERSTELGDGGVWTSLPLLNSFVGGDLWAGLFWLWKQGQMDQSNWILMDVGTNSEILYWTGDRLIVASTPAGPAFEGSNISIGMRAEAGAIVDPRYDKEQKKWSFQVIGDDLPRGICGSALIQAVSVALHSNLLSSDGEIKGKDKISLNSDLSLSQADIREFQLAKSAIRTGLELVMKTAGKRADRLLLAGSFGEHMPLESAKELGLLPHIPTTAIGNSSLMGTIAWGQASAEEKEIFSEWISKVKEPVELALADEFQDMFIASMNLCAGS